MTSSSNDVPPPTNPVLEAYESFVANTPLMSRCILSTQAISYLVSWFVDPQYALSNIPYFTVFKFEIYRLLLSPLVNTSIISLIFAFLSFSDHGKRLEHSMGSTAFAWLCLMIAFLTNVAFLLLSFVLYAFSKETSYLMASASGIWLILFGTIAMECVQAPRGIERRLFFFNVPVLYYPLALYLFFAFVSGNLFSLGDLLSMAIGYAFGFGYLDFLKLSSVRARQWEDSVLINFARRDGWIAGQAVMGSGAWNDMGESSGIGIPLFRRATQGEAGQDHHRQSISSLLGSATTMNEGNDSSSEQPTSSSFATTTTTPPGRGRTLGGASSRRGTDETRAARLQALEQKAQDQNA